MNVRLANVEELSGVYKLTHDVYVQMGYCQPQENGILCHYPHLDNIKETFVLVAMDGDKLLGTNSWTLDSKHGLHVDCDFSEHVNTVRHRCQKFNRKLAASWRIVTNPDQRNTLRTIKSLVQSTVDMALDYGVDTMLFSFNPKHERIYQKMVGMTTLATGICHATNAPAVLMMAERETLKK